MKDHLRKFFRNRYIRWVLYAGILFLLLVLIANIWIIRSVSGRLFSETSSIPFRKVGMVLGTSKDSRYGGPNLFFRYRIDAAVQLFRAGKIKHILVSGDNHVRYYDEAKDMHDALVRNGIPDSCITLDYAGFRTFDSVVRCKEVFGQDSITVISQEFHNERAVFIAGHFGIDAVGFNAREVKSQYAIRTTIREYFAKFKCILDLYILNTGPKFLGEKVPINI